MASKYPTAWMDELRSRSDIVQIVSGYVSLKKNGRRHLGLCPFHSEKTASFSVDGERQLFYCFGCKAGGDVITFVMNIERLSFPEAVEMLAERAHLPVPELEEDPEYERRRSQKERLLEANRQAARFYHDLLYRPEGAASLAYLKKRGLSAGIITKFGLGASPDSWTSLSDHLLSQGFTLEELSLAGLTYVSADRAGPKPRYHDVFRSRAMFPIIDAHRNVIAFGGRLLTAQKEQKYLNTSDTPVFNKRFNIYAANLLRQQRNLERVILVEGYMDVVSLAEFGIEGVCATLGTAFTNEQARLMHRFAPQVYLAYDGDAAGQRAILRGLSILEQEGIPCRVIDFPDGLDPDEFIRRDGAEAFRALPLLSPTAYRLRRLKEGYNLADPEKRMEFAREAVKLLSNLDPVERETYLRSLSVETGFDREILLDQLRRVAPPEEDHPDSAREKSSPRPVSRRFREAPPSEETVAQERLIGILASGQIPKDLVEEKDFGDDELKSLYVNLKSGMSVQELVSSAPDDSSRSRFARILMAPPARDTDELIAMANDCVRRLRRRKLQARLDELMKQVSQASGPEKDALTREAQEIARKLNS